MFQAEGNPGLGAKIPALSGSFGNLLHIARETHSFTDSWRPPSLQTVCLEDLVSWCLQCWDHTNAVSWAWIPGTAMTLDCVWADHWSPLWPFPWATVPFVCAFIPVSLRAHACTLVCGGQRSTLAVVSQELSTSVFWGRTWSYWLGKDSWPASCINPPASSFSTLRSQPYLYILLFTWGLGIEFRSPCFVITKLLTGLKEILIDKK